jgi:hypothetical protein
LAAVASVDCVLEHLSLGHWHTHLLAQLLKNK